MKNGNFLLKGTIFFIFCFTLCVCLTIQAKEKQTICLNMIVKNESKVIERCLKTVKPLIDYWVIVDTGSSDGTQTVVKEYMRDIPGELHERPWVNFEHNRNQALQLAKNKGDYILTIDADEQLIYDKDFVKPTLDKDWYHIIIDHAGNKYPRKMLINNHLNWKWIGVLHEYLNCPEAKTSGTLQNVVNLFGFDGCRSQDPKKFAKDAAILEEALKKEPDNDRYVLYLAHSYRDAGQDEKAIGYFQKRIKMGRWDQEVYWCYFQIGLAEQRLKKDPSIFTESYYKAFKYRPTRIEPLYQLANHYRNQENYLLGYLLAKHALTIPCSKDIVFVEDWMYQYGLLMEYSLCAYYIGKYQEAKEASDKMLQNTKLPQNVRDCVNRNLTWIEPKLEKKVVKLSCFPVESKLEYKRSA